MDNNDNKLDLLTKKIYEEGIEKAQQDAKSILEKAQQDAQNIIDEANAKANAIVEKANNDAANLKHLHQLVVAIYNAHTRTSILARG